MKTNKRLKNPNWTTKRCTCAATLVCALELSHFTTIYNHINDVTKSKLLSTCVRMSAHMRLRLYQINKNHTHETKHNNRNTPPPTVVSEEYEKERQANGNNTQIDDKNAQKIRDKRHKTTSEKRKRQNVRVRRRRNEKKNVIRKMKKREKTRNKYLRNIDGQFITICAYNLVFELGDQHVIVSENL